MLKRLLLPLLLIVALLALGVASAARALDAGTLGGIALAIAVFGLLSAAAMMRRAQDRAAELEPVAGTIRLPDISLQEGQAALDQLLQERAALRAEMLAAGIELSPDSQGMRRATSGT